MKNIKLSVLLAVIFAILLSITAYAGSEPMPLVMDEADILTEDEEE